MELKDLTEPYRYVIFRCWNKADLRKVSEGLEKSFRVEMIVLTSDKTELSLHTDDREKLKVSADTLRAMLFGYKAILFQKEATPLTANDLELREKLLDLYPQRRPTPFPWSFSHEPKFKVSR